MVFSSVTFLFLFLPIVLALYHGFFFLPVLLGRPSRIWFQLSNAFLLFASLVFYYWGEKNLVLIFIGTTAVDFIAALLISRAPLERGAQRTLWQKWILALSIGTNLSILLIFKYLTFTADAVNGLLKHAGTAIPVPQVTLPLGISFFIFHSMSYTIDVYRGEVTATRNFIDYACYVLMFPQLVAGPIVRFSYVARSLVQRTVSAEYFSRGIGQFVIGLGKKVLIANVMGETADKIFALSPGQLSASTAWLGALAYTIQIYFDFSGYSDMAIGLGRMFGFELPLNFNYPYIAASVRDFWRRWHISLSTWFRDYLYLPLGGSRKGAWRTARNLILVFFLCGLWHGAKWTFVAWGLYHGCFLVLERNRRIAAILARLPWLGRVYALVIVIVGWVLFRADTFSQAVSFLRAMAGAASPVDPYPLQWFLRPGVALALCFGVVFSAPLLPAMAGWLDRRLRSGGGKDPWSPAVAAFQLAGLALVLVACSIRIASGTYNPFIYFRF